MAETLQINRLGGWSRESTVAIGGDYLTEEQATALRTFIERLNAVRQHKTAAARNGPGDAGVDTKH